MRKNLLPACLLAAGGLFALPGAVGPVPAAQQTLVDVTVVRRGSGERLTPYRHEGRLYVAGTPGEPYSIELRSRSGGRLLTVVSVDGVNVLTGQTAAPLQSGYVIDPGRRYGISGWRKSLDDVARFVFTALPDSYAARTGRPDHVGVIGVAVFREKPEAPRAAAPAIGNALPSSEPRAMAKATTGGSAAAGASAENSGQPAAPAPRAEGLADRRSDSVASGTAEKESRRLGTGHGERERAPTRWTEFERAADVPDEIVTIYYDSRSNLIARGIIRGPRYAEPSPFPAGPGFVPDPRS